VRRIARRRKWTGRGGQELDVRAESSDFVVDVPPLAMHAIVTAEFER